MAEVEQNMLKFEDIHADFQLWVTTEPHVKFPIGLLQMSIKITNEAPAGVRAGLKASYAGITQDTLDSVSHPDWKTMLYALCFLHTIVQERRKVITAANPAFARREPIARSCSAAGSRRTLL